MPLARIITRNPQDAFAVSEYLRSQGYTVETVSPEEFRVTPAELELNLGRRGSGRALEYAKALVESRLGAAQAQTEAPAAPEPPQPQKTKIAVAYDSVGRPVEFAEEKLPDRRQEPGSTRKALASLLNRVTVSVRDFPQRRAEQRARKLEVGLARRREQKLARERARQEMEQRRAEAELAEQRLQEQIAAEQQAAQERARAAALHEARIVAEREAARQQHTELAVGEKPAPQQLTGRSPEPAPPFVARRRRPSLAILRTVIATAFGAGLLLLLGFVAYSNRRPASPLLPGALMMNTSVKQEVPFGPVTLTPAAASKPSPVAVVPNTSRVGPTARVPRRKPQPLLRPQN